MALWKIEPTSKKSIVDRIHWTKGDKTIIHEIGWRWGEFVVKTFEDDPPKIDEYTDLHHADDFELMDFSTDDGCWEELEFDGFINEEEEEFRERLESGDISTYDLEQEGWDNTDVELYIQCEVEITKIEEPNEK